MDQRIVEKFKKEVTRAGTGILFVLHQQIHNPI